MIFGVYASTVGQGIQGKDHQCCIYSLISWLSTQVIPPFIPFSLPLSWFSLWRLPMDSCCKCFCFYFYENITELGNYKDARMSMTTQQLVDACWRCSWRRGKLCGLVYCSQSRVGISRLWLPTNDKSERDYDDMNRSMINLFVFHSISEWHPENFLIVV